MLVMTGPPYRPVLGAACNLEASGKVWLRSTLLWKRAWPRRGGEEKAKSQ